MKTQDVLAADDEFVVGPDTVLAQTAATVGEAFLAFGSPVPVQARGDAQAQEHALNLDQELLVALRQAHADALALIALHAAIGVEEAAKEADVEGGGCAMHGSRDRLASGPEAEVARQMPERAELHSILAAAGYRVPAAKIGTVAQRSRRVVGGVHDGVHPRTLAAAICRQGTRPRGKDGGIVLQGPIADQQTDQVAFRFRMGAGPAGRAAVIVDQDLVAGPEVAGLDPFRLDDAPTRAGNAANPMVRGEAQAIAFLGRQVENLSAPGREKAARIRPRDGAVHDRFEGAADQFPDLSRALRCLDPAIGRDAGVGGEDLLAVGEVVGPVDAVDEDHAGLGVGVGGADHPLPQGAGRDGAVDDAVEGKLPRPVVLHRLHEGVAHQHREVEHAQPARVALGLDEVLDVRVVAAQAAHHRAAPEAGAHDGAAHRVPHVHEGERARGIRAHALDRRPLGPERREVVADAAALLHGERGFLQMLEDRRHVVADRPHHEAVEERDLPLGAGAGEDAARRQEAEALERVVEGGLPAAGLRLDRGERAGHPPPAVLDRAVDGRAVRRLEAVLHVPDAGRDGQHLGHGDPAAPAHRAVRSPGIAVRSLFRNRTVYLQRTVPTI